MGYNVSKTERANILILGAFVSGVNLANMLTVWLHEAYNPPPFAIYDISRQSLFPAGRFLSIFIFVFILFARKYVASLLWSIFCLAPFLYEFIWTYHFFYHNWVDLLQRPALEVLYLTANPLDYLATFLTIILLFWQLSIVIRPHIFKTTGSSL